MNIVKRVVIQYQLIVRTGLHIGGSKESFGIGGVDAPVIKNPLTNQPIIPGSSLKGKIRMLLESVDDVNNPLIKKAFGPLPKDTKENNPLTRVIFRDLELTKESKEELESKLGKGYFTEIKAENLINKTTGKAESPRFIERVPAGAVFEGEFIVQYLDEDRDGEFENLIKKGFGYLENNFLGGSGSRGYGKVEYKKISRKELGKE